MDVVSAISIVNHLQHLLVCTEDELGLLVRVQGSPLLLGYIVEPDNYSISKPAGRIVLLPGKMPGCNENYRQCMLRPDIEAWTLLGLTCELEYLAQKYANQRAHPKSLLRSCYLAFTGFLLTDM